MKHHYYGNPEPNPNPAIAKATGEITSSIRVANGGGWLIFNMRTMAGLMNGWRTEFHLEMWQVGKLLFKGTPDPVDNRVQIPDAPGLGFEPDLDVLRDSRISQPDP